MKKLLALLLMIPTLSLAADTTGYSGRLKATMLAACPNITSINLVVRDDRGVGLDLEDDRRASYALNAVPDSETICADVAVLTFDWRQSTQNAWDIEHLRSDAIAVVASEQTSNAKLTRSVVAVLLDEINVLRAALPIPVTSITRSGTTGTVTTRGPHGLTGTPTLLVTGADVAAYNGQVVMTVTGANTLTYTVASGATPAAGSILLFTSGTLDARTRAQAITAIGNKLTVGGGD